MARKTWPPCDVCREPVTTKEGVILVDEIKALEIANESEVEEARNLAEHDYRHTVVNLGDSGPPEEVRWWYGHTRCFLDHAGEYWIPTTRIDTPRKALGWTLHLMEKRWLPYTDWDAMMRRLEYVEYS
jgi:hypothetical protein